MLQTIAVMADEGSLTPIQSLIINLSKVLRYVSSTAESTATLGTEVEYAECYLAAMRARFGASLEYLIDVPDAMRQIVVPRLIVQPFIENCFKYATVARPPWRIELRGAASEGGWTVEIRDNGPGLSEATLERIEERIEERIAARKRKGEGLAPMSISGMGMLNSYERLRLAFGERAFFSIGNLPGGGARVVIGAETNG
jgi:sensor histidine kinase YesM